MSKLLKSIDESALKRIDTRIRKLNWEVETLSKERAQLLARIADYRQTNLIPDAKFTKPAPTT